MISACLASTPPQESFAQVEGAAQDAELLPGTSAEAEEPSFRGALTFFIENDVFVYSDDKYTSGIGVGWTSPEVGSLGNRNWLRRMFEGVSFLPTVGEESYDGFVTMTFGQEMYTPADVTLPEPPPGDQPYAGVLFLDTAVHSRGVRSMHSYQLRLGIVGPSSGAEQVQRKIHEWLGTTNPEGWDSQLADEALLNLDYRYDRRLLRDQTQDGWGYDFNTHGSAGLGNYYVGANAGIQARGGLHLPDNYDKMSLRSGARSLVGVNPLARGRWRSYVYLGIEAFAVGRFLPTDGNTFHDSLSADRDDLILSSTAGIIVARGRVLLAYSFSSVGGIESFPEATSNDYGTLTFSYSF
jgi:lipid A 3-O-deacylase